MGEQGWGRILVLIELFPLGLAQPQLDQRVHIRLERLLNRVRFKSELLLGLEAVGARGVEGGFEGHLLAAHLRKTFCRRL